MPLVAQEKLPSGEELVARAVSDLDDCNVRAEGQYSVILTLKDGSKFRLLPTNDNWVRLGRERVSHFVERSNTQYTFFDMVFFPSNERASFHLH